MGLEGAGVFEHPSETTHIEYKSKFCLPCSKNAKIRVKISSYLKISRPSETIRHRNKIEFDEVVDVAVR